VTALDDRITRAELVPAYDTTLAGAVRAADVLVPALQAAIDDGRFPDVETAADVLLEIDDLVKALRAARGMLARYTAKVLPWKRKKLRFEALNFEAERTAKGEWKYIPPAAWRAIAAQVCTVVDPTSGEILTVPQRHAELILLEAAKFLGKNPNFVITPFKDRGMPLDGIAEWIPAEDAEPGVAVRRLSETNPAVGFAARIHETAGTVADV